MMLKDGTSSHEEYSFVSSLLAALCFLVVIAIFISRLFKQAGSCCSDLCKRNQKTKGDNNERRYSKLAKQPSPSLRYEPLTPALKLQPTSFSVENLDSFKYAVFEIPGKISSQTVQPLEDSTSGYSGSNYLSVVDGTDSSSEGRVFVDEFVQPGEKELFTPSINGDVFDDACSRLTDGTLNPELYSPFLRKKTQGLSSLGKIKFSLQYDDKNKKKLIMSLHEITGLHYHRTMENVVGLYISAVLLPERDYRFQSSHLVRAECLTLNEVFTFHSRPLNRDFESRTVHLTVVFMEKNSKETVYGESRLPLLSHEIYSQVPTDICIGVKPCPAQSEIGDAQIMLSYSSEQQKLNVFVKSLKFINPAMLENLTGVHVKAHLARVGGDRFGKKRHISKNIRAKSVNFVDFDEQMAFRLQPENFMLCTLKLNMHGKHKIMGKHLSLGKVRIGDSNRDEAGKCHWKAAFSSEGIGWTVWHPIYGA